MRYEDFYRQSIDEPGAFWAEQARRIHWDTPPQQILDQSQPPFRRWFVGGTTNLCYNAVDRHLAERAEQPALVAVSSETGITREFSYRQLHREVNAFAAVLQSLDVGRGDRVVIKTTQGEVMCKQVGRLTAQRVELKSLNPEYDDRAFAITELAFMHRIIWSSQ